MGLGNEKAIADRFAAYIGELTKVIGHADREGPLRDYCSGLPAAEGRHNRDVLAHEGVSHVVVFMGTNDIRREASAEQVIGGLKEIVARVRARGLKIIGVTIVPRHNVAPVAANTGWDAKTKVRNEVNAWIRGSGAFDGVIDFDRVVRSAANPDVLL